jgi:hypothetical protein
LFKIRGNDDDYNYTNNDNNITGEICLFSALWIQITNEKSTLNRAKQDVLREARMVHDEPSAAK